MWLLLTHTVAWPGSNNLLWVSGIRIRIKYRLIHDRIRITLSLQILDWSQCLQVIFIGIKIRGFHFYTGVDIENNPQSTLKLVMDPDPSLIDIRIHNSTPSPLTAMRIKIAFAWFSLVQGFFFGESCGSGFGPDPNYDPCSTFKKESGTLFGSRSDFYTDREESKRKRFNTKKGQNAQISTHSTLKKCKLRKRCAHLKVNRFLRKFD